MFKPIESFLGLMGEFSEPYPNEKGTSDMVALNTRFAALTVLEPGKLFDLAVKLLNLPAQAAHLLNGLRGCLSGAVSHNIIRSVGRHRDSEKLHLVVLGKTSKFDALALLLLLVCPVERIGAAVRLRSPGVVN